MKPILIGIAEFELRLAQQNKQSALKNLKWTTWECAIFGAIGLFFAISPVFGASMWYMATASVYGILVWFFIFKIRPRWISAVWQSNRRIAEARIRLRKLETEEE